MSNEEKDIEEVTGAAEEAETAAEETVAEEAEAAAEETAAEEAEAAKETEEAAEEVTQEAEEAVKETAQAPKQTVKKPAASKKAAPVIKKKKKVNMTTLIVIIAAVVVVLACAVYTLSITGTLKKWFPSKASYTLAAHDTIEISEADVEVTDDSIETYVTSFQSAYETDEEVTSGTVEDGDKVHITYVGTIDGEEFDGGSTDEDGADLTIGSGSYIDGFEDGLIGANIGDTVTLDLTFPDDYSNTDVAGKDVTFVVTIEYKTVTNTPEFTDDFVKTNSLEYTESSFDEAQQFDTVDEFKDFVKDRLYNYQLEDAIEDKLDTLITVKSYDGTIYDLMYSYESESLEYYASYYGVDSATLASYYGYDDAETYCTEETEYQLTLAMLYSALADELGITHTDEEIDESIQEYMDENGYSDSYSLEDFKSLNGEAWIYMYKNYQMNYDPVMDAMKERVVLVAEEETETTTEETTAAE